MDVGPLWLPPRERLEHGLGGTGSTQRQLRFRERQRRCIVVGLERERSAEAIARALEVAALRPHARQREVQIGIVGLQRERASQLRLGRIAPRQLS